MASTMRHRKDARAESSDYFKHWSTAQNSKDEFQDADARERRKENYEDLANDFYDNSTDFYLEGWGQSFHFCRYPRGREPMPQAMARHEHYMAYALNLRPGMKVLDVGCGIGGPAKEIAAFVGCKVVGLNNNHYQLQKGREIAEKEGVTEDALELVKGDFLKIPFPDNSFDAIYAIEATVHAPSLAAVYSEISRVLKPGGLFGVYEWVMMADTFDASIPRHVYLRHGIERGNGIACIRTSAEAQDAMREAGFVIRRAENLGDNTDPIPWWYICSGSTEFAYGWADWGRVARMTGVGRVLLDLTIRGLEYSGIARKGTASMAKELIHGGDCIGEAGRQKLFTPMYFMIGQKPENIVL